MKKRQPSPFNVINNVTKFVTSSASFRVLVSLVVLSLISACSTFSFDTSPNKPVNVTSALQLKEWQARGKVLLKNNNEKVSGYFFWHQNDDDFTLSLNSFIGTNVLTLSFQNQQAELQVDGKTYKGRDPETLIYRVTGNQIPVNTMSKWMMANVDTDSSNITQVSYFDEKQVEEFSTNKDNARSVKRLSSFVFKSQQNQQWQVKYKSYKSQGLLTLPNTLNVQTSQHRIKLTINDWEFIR